MRSRATFVFAAADYEPVALFLALLSVLRGAWFLSPIEAMSGFLALYHRHLDLAPEKVWGYVFFFIGVGQLIGAFGGWPRWTRQCFYAAGLIWMVSGTLFLMTNHASAAGPIYLFIGLGALWVYVRSGMEEAP